MIDLVGIVVQGGRGGPGKVGFRREKYLPRGGPDGGDGGKGGDVILRCSGEARDLGALKKGKQYRGGDGAPGGPRKRHGRDGQDIVLSVPLGTVARGEGVASSDDVVAELVREGECVLVARGGKGGRGNARLATAGNRAPAVAERGRAGEVQRVILELKLPSDVAMVGLPNVGKSTLLRALTRAQPEVAAYPFTTVEAQVGVVEVDLEHLVLAEMPGLVEGARSGVGIGIGFLRHMERTRVLMHLLDGSRPDPTADLEMVCEELRAFSGKLLAKPQLIVVNKVDLPEARAGRKELERALGAKASDVWFISAATGEGLPELVRAMVLAVRGAREREEAVPREATVLRPRPSLRFTVTKVQGTFVVEGERPVALVEMMGVDDDEARAEVLRRLKRMGVAAALRRAGARAGHRVRFGEVEMEWEG